MLRGLLGIRLKSEFVRRNFLGDQSPIYHLSGPSIFGMDLPTPFSGLAPHHVLHVVNLAYLDDMQDASV
jgi:hypothetical protein